MEMLPDVVGSCANPNPSYLFRLSRTPQEKDKIDHDKQPKESCLPLKQHNLHTERFLLFNQALFGLPIKLNIGFKCVQISFLYGISKLKQNI